MNWRRLLRGGARYRRCSSYCVVTCTLLATTLIVFVAHQIQHSSHHSPRPETPSRSSCVENGDGTVPHSHPCVPTLALKAPRADRLEEVGDADPVTYRLGRDKLAEGVAEDRKDEQVPDLAGPLDEDDLKSLVAEGSRETTGGREEAAAEEAQTVGDDPREARRVRKLERGIPLVVVEEHHDVIPHWYAGVDLGLLPRHGNVLVGGSSRDDHEKKKKEKKQQQKSFFFSIAFESRSTNNKQRNKNKKQNKTTTTTTTTTPKHILP